MQSKEGIICLLFLSASICAAIRKILLLSANSSLVQPPSRSRRSCPMPRFPASPHQLSRKYAVESNPHPGPPLSEREREKLPPSSVESPFGDSSTSPEFFSLAPSDGERAGVRARSTA